MMTIPGMKDFFGKKMGGFVLEQLAHLSPVNLTAGEIGARIAASSAKDGMVGTVPLVAGAIRGAIKNRGNYRVGDWFQGFNIGEAREGLSQSLLRRRIGMRVGIPAAIGLSSVASMFAPQNPLSTVIDTGANLGVTGTLAGVLGRHDWRLGAGVTGWAALNALRRGDNFGPF